MNPKPNYYAVIPANVRYSDIPSGSKLLFGELTALSTREGYCWATNKYFAEIYETHVDTITSWLGALQKNGFIRMEVDKMAGNKRKIWMVSDKFGLPLPEKIRVATRENTVPSISIKNNISDKSQKEENSDIVEVPISSDGDERAGRPKREKADISYRAVFQAFKEKYPKNWDLNRTQIQAAKNLLEERGLKGVKAALEFHRENSEHEFCPTITSPYDLDSKWSKLFAFKTKYG